MPGNAEDTRIICLGDVPDIDTVIAAADVCLAPLAAGAGVKTKVLDYIAHGRPVLATPVAIEGIEDAPGVSTAELQQFGARLAELLSRHDDAGEEQNRQQAQQFWIRDRHGGDRVAEQWRTAFKRVGIRI
jgi:glycosyltransferase involved in cell wall biosynthesis